MRTAITLARVHGSKEFKVVAGPEPIHQTIATTKQLRVAGVHPRYAEIHVWSSDAGRMLTFRLAEPPKAKVVQSEPKAK